MTGIDVYRMYSSVHLHFTSASWNPNRIKDGNFFVRCSYDTFNKKSNKRVFDYISGVFDKKQWFRFVIANEMYGYTDSIYHLEEGKHNTSVWEKRRIGFDYWLHQDLDILRPHFDSGNITRNSCVIVKLLTSNLITIETAAAINRYWNITKAVRDSKFYCSILDPLLLRIDRSDPFIKIPPQCVSELENVMH